VVLSSECADESDQKQGTGLMRAVTGLQHGDTIGVAVQQSDLPMIQLFLNGEPLHELAISRFRGAVHPAIFVQNEFRAKFIFNENEFKEISPHVRFGPLIAARGII